jgi:hypothetical protein
MSQDNNIPDSKQDKIVLLGDAAWTLLATHPIDQIDFDVVADMAGVDRGVAGALSGSVQFLVLARMTELDRQSLMETYDDIQDAGAVSIREKIIESLLHWFETYAPYRPQIDQLNRSARSHPDLALRLFVGLEALIRHVLVMSGDPALGFKGMLRVKGVAGVFLATARVWMKDDSNDLATTMKTLDQRMSQAEEWGISLRIFDGGLSHDGPKNWV